MTAFSMTDKNKIQATINQFSQGNLRTNAIALFNALGYQSSLTFAEPTSVERYSQIWCIGNFD
jgi:hypothetical protein